MSNLTGILLGILSSLIASIVFWLVFFKISRTNVKFSLVMAKSKNIEEYYAGENRYRIKLVNSGMRDLIEISFLVRITVKCKGNISNYTFLGIGNENKIPILYGKKYQYKNTNGLGGAQMLTLYPVEVTYNEFKKTIYSKYLQKQSAEKKLCLDDIFYEYGNNADIVIFVYGNDALTGARKLFTSPVYKINNIKFGEYKIAKPLKNIRYGKWVNDTLAFIEKTNSKTD